MKQICKILVISLIFLSGFIASPHKLQIQADGRINPWMSLEFNRKIENFQFVIVSDRTGGARKGIFEDAINKVNLLQPEFVVCVGDLIEGYTNDANELDKQWDEFENIINKLEMPFFYVAGNHDISNDIGLKKWKQRFGRTYYHFVYNDVLFLCLDTEGCDNQHKAGFINQRQIDYFREVLDKNTNVRWTLVFMHQPLWEHDNSNWLEFEKILTDRDYTVFAGHEHQYAKNVRNGKNYIRFATTGGESSLNGPAVGVFDHIVWVTMSDKGPRLANLMLNGIYDENVTLYEIAMTAKTLQKKIKEGKVITSEPVVIRKGEKQVKAKMKIANFAEIPMKVAITLRDNPDVNIIPERIEKEIAPASSEELEVEVRFGSLYEFRELSVIDLDAVISYQFDKNQSPVESIVPCKITICKAAE